MKRIILAVLAAAIVLNIVGFALFSIGGSHPPVRGQGVEIGTPR